MRLKRISIVAMLAAVGAVTQAQDVPANHLLLTEIGINPQSQSDANGFAEYVEIYNPTANPISLDNYYITDYSQYYNFPIFVAGGVTPDVGASDYITQFPPGSTLQPGQVAVVCHMGNTLLKDFYSNSLANFQAASSPAPLLFETEDTNPSIPNTINHNANAASSTFSKTNAGEHVILFFFNGGDLVKDVDMVSWGNSPEGDGNAIVQKGGIESDGPDPDGNLTAYPQDNGHVYKNFDVEPRFDPNTLVRRSTIEIGETATTGNGHTGNDESFEWNWDTWGFTEDNGGTPGGEVNANPGAVPGLVKNSDNPPPFLGAISRSVQHPVPGQAFKITCRAGGVTPPTVRLYIKLNANAAYNAPITMTFNVATQEYEATVGPYVEGTHIAYYFEAVQGAYTVRFPLQTGLRLEYFNTEYHINVLADPIDENDIFINEIMANPSNTENLNYSEFVEIYNARNVPINISGYTCSDSVGNAERCAVRDGHIIPANGYLVFAHHKPSFEARYSGEPSYNTNLVPWVIDSYSGANPGLDNGGDTPSVCDCNNYRWKNRPTVPFDTVTYDNGAPTTSPWPNEVNGKSIELKALNLDNSDGNNWASSIDAGAQGGSPLIANQQASVADWSVY